MKTVQEISRQCGISVRTLHYYDEIGLLPPGAVTDAGYRLYGDDQLRRLQQILFFRELGFPLKEIREIIGNPSFDQNKALQNHLSVLTMKRERLDGLIRLVNQLIKGEPTMSIQEFDNANIEATRQKYAEEARQRWGKTDAYRESERRSNNYSKEDWAKINAEAEEIYKAFASCMTQGATSAAALECVARWQQHITDHFYPCTDEILAGLGEMYVADERFTKNIDEHAPGLARFLSDAIAVYCADKTK